MTGWRAARGRLEAGRPGEGCIRVRDGLAALDLASNFKNKKKKKQKLLEKRKGREEMAEKERGGGERLPASLLPKGSPWRLFEEERSWDCDTYNGIVSTS
jgi:hypothetical protein